MSLRGWEANDQRVAAYGREVTWQDPPAQTTGADGTFAFTFAPPPPYQFMLRIERPSCVTLVGRWGEIAPGTTKDLGDVRMSLGSLVSGRIVDTAGAPQANVHVYLNPAPRDVPASEDTSEMRPRDSTDAPTAADGTFTCAAPFAPGRYELRLRQRQLVEPEHVTIPESGAPVFVEVRVRALADVPAITGAVVDENGAPVADAGVVPMPGSGNSVTGHDGTFRVERLPHEDTEAVWVSVMRSGYEDAKTDRAVPWGTKDLRLLMRRARDVELLVLEGDGEQPVEEYGVRCFLDKAFATSWSDADYRLRDGGRHEGGLLVLRGRKPGPTWLDVEPVADRLHPSPFLRFVVGDGGAARQVVRLYPPAERLLQVVRADGAPVAGTKVELLQSLGDAPVDLRTRAADRSRLTNACGALLLQEATTDAAGELRLRGPRPHPGATPLAVRVLGPGHAPIVVSPVSLHPDTTPLRVEVPSGATLRGTITPARVLAQLRSDTSGLPDMVRQRPDATWQPGLRLWSRSAGESVTAMLPADGPYARFPIAAGGTFDVQGIPAGTWDVALTCTEPHGSHGSGTAMHVLLPGFVLRDGDVREVALDASFLLRGKVEGVVKWARGGPWQDASVSLLRLREGQEPLTWAGVQGVAIAADGTFVTTAPSGTYQAVVEFIDPGRSGRAQRLPAGGPIHVVADVSTCVTLDVRTAHLRLRLLGADGHTPAAGVVVQFGIDALDTWSENATTNADGVVEFVAPPIPLQVYVWPKALLTPEGQREHRASRRGSDWRPGLVSLGTVTPRADTEAEPGEFTLPAAAGY